MSRWVNRLLSKAYTRFPSLSERHGRRAGSFDDVRLPRLTGPHQPLHDCRVAILTAGGVHLSGQPPFDMRDPEGDGSWRTVPQHALRSDLTITHDYYDHGAADEDVNCVFPIDRLTELARARVIGEPAPRHVGMMGHLSGAQLARLVDRSAPDIVALLKEDAVDVVLAVPG